MNFRMLSPVFLLACPASHSQPFVQALHEPEAAPKDNHAQRAAETLGIAGLLLSGHLLRPSRQSSLSRFSILPIHRRRFLLMPLPIVER
jgi:hypothetical protein